GISQGSGVTLRQSGPRARQSASFCFCYNASGRSDRLTTAASRPSWFPVIGPSLRSSGRPRSTIVSNRRFYGGTAIAHLDATVGLDASQALPVVRKIGIADLRDALVKGIDDFRAMPTHAIFLSIIYPVGAVIVAQLTLNDLFHLFFPLAAGFALIGP